MTDPWADVRAEIYKTITVVDPDKAEALLNDADALLAVARAAKKWADMRGRPVYPTETELMAALDLLPEHLK